eukprot:superscaffoldBa00003117_g16163
MLITDLAATVTFVELCEEVRTMCSVAKQQPITLKWIDDEGDPCTISSQMELEEAFRIYNRTKRSGLLLHVFPSIPERPGMPCPGEDIPTLISSSSLFKETGGFLMPSWVAVTHSCCSFLLFSYFSNAHTDPSISGQQVCFVMVSGLEEGLIFLDGASSIYFHLN